MPGERVKVGIVGLGARGQSHLEVILALGDTLELVAACDRNERSLAEAATVAGRPLPTCTTLDEMLSGDRPDFVVVCTKSTAIPGICGVLLRAGVAALTEVPPAVAGPPAREMLELSHSSGVALAAAENYVCTPLELLKRALIAEGTFGEIREAEVWGSINHKGHELAVARSYLGFERRPVRMTARADGRGRRTLEAIPIPAVLSGTVEFDSGARMHVKLSGWGSKGPRVPIVGIRNDFVGSLGGCRDGRFYLGRDRFSEGWRELRLEPHMGRIDGTDTIVELGLESAPGVRWRNPFADRSFPHATRLPSMQHIEDLPQAWEIAIANLLLNMADVVRGKATPEYPVERAMTDVRIRLGLLESAARGGEWVDWQEEPYDVERKLLGFRPYRLWLDLRRRFPLGIRRRR